MSKLGVSIATLGFSFLPLAPALAQSLGAAPIIPAADATGTLVNTAGGDRFDITGGSRSSNGQNLFHSFETFGLDASQTANFIAAPEIQNILGRVTGGDTSYIDGRVQVSNGSANLFLINPAGILTGVNARIELSGSFTATTADQIGFSQGWLNALGNGEEGSDYSGFNGAPDRFQFSTATPGNILNQGQITVGDGQVIRLLGDTVVNTGILTAPEGEITLLSNTGSQTVNFGDDGAIALGTNAIGNPLLSLNAPNVSTIADMLQQTPGAQASGFSRDADGTVRLEGTAIPAGAAIASGELAADGGQGGKIQILGDRVGLMNANVNSSGINGGGTILIGGEYQGNGTVPNAQQTFIDADSILQANALTSGDGGRVIVWADSTTVFYGEIEARGGFTGGDGGFVEVSGKNNLGFAGDVDVAAVIGQNGQLLLDPGTVNIDSTGSNDATAFGAVQPNEITRNQGGTNQTFSISANRIETALNTGDVAIAAAQEINVNEPISATGNTSVLALSAPQINVNDPITLAGGDINLTGSQIDLRQSEAGAILDSGGGNITLEGDVKLNSSYQPNQFFTERSTTIDSTADDRAGDILITGGIEIDNLAFNPNSLFINASGFDIDNPGDVRIDGNVGLSEQFQRLEISGNTVSLAGLNASRLNLDADTDIAIDSAVALAINSFSEVNANRDISITAPSLSIVDSGSGSDGLVAGRSLSITTTDPAGLLTVENSRVLATESLGLTAAAEMTVSTNSSNRSNLSGSEVTIQAQGNIQISETLLEATTQGLTITTPEQITVGSSQLRAQTDLSLQGRTLNLNDTNAPLVVAAEQNLSLTGNDGITIQALTQDNSVVRSGADLTLNSSGPMVANARLASGGNFTAGTGTLTQPGLTGAGIISADGDVSFGDYTGSALKVEATGSITAGDITITEVGAFPVGADPDIATLNAGGPALVLRAGVPALANPSNLPPSQNRSGTTLEQIGDGSAAIALKVGNINTQIGSGFTLDAGPVVLTSTGTLETGDIQAGRLDAAATGDMTLGSIRTSGAPSFGLGSDIPRPEANGNVSLSSETGNITSGTIFISLEGSLSVKADGTFRIPASSLLNFTSFGPSDVPTSIIVPDSIAITQGGKQFTAGLTLERNEEGGLLFRDADGDRVVFQMGNSSPASFEKTDGTNANYPVSINTVAIDLDSVPIDESYTAGGIFIGNNSDAALYGSFQDSQLSQSDSIEVVTVPRVPDPPEPNPPEPELPKPNPPGPDVPEPNQPEPDPPEPNQPEPSQPEPTPNPTEPSPSSEPSSTTTVADASGDNDRDQRSSDATNSSDCLPGGSEQTAQRSSEADADDDAVHGGTNRSESTQSDGDPCRPSVQTGATEQQLLRTVHEPQLPPDAVPPEFSVQP